MWHHLAKSHRVQLWQPSPCRIGHLREAALERAERLGLGRGRVPEQPKQRLESAIVPGAQQQRREAENLRLPLLRTGKVNNCSSSMKKDEI